MKRVLFLKPSMVSDVNPEVTPPLGLLYLTAYLRRQGRVEARFFDMRISNPKSLESVLQEFRPHVVGFSALTVEAKEVERLVHRLRKTTDDVVTVVGGPHATHYTSEFMADPNIDYAVLGEGEETLGELMEVIQDGKPSPKEVLGLAHRSNGEVLVNPPRPYIKDLDQLPFPAWEDLDFDTYAATHPLSAIPKKDRYMAIFTSRACPFRCIYCHHVFGKGFRARSPENVLTEMMTLKEEYGVKHFEVLDDVFNFDRPRAEEICDRIVANGMNISLYFTNGLRSDRLPRELLEKLKAAGTRKISVAVETASPRLQKMLKRDLDLGKVKKAIQDSAELGILTNTLYMIGFPTEKESEIQDTIRFATASKAHTAHFFIVNPFWGTELAEVFKQQVQRASVNYEDFSYVRSKHNLSDVDTERLNRLQRSAYRRFYFSLGRWWRILPLFPNKQALLKKAVRTLRVKMFPN